MQQQLLLFHQNKWLFYSFPCYHMLYKAIHPAPYQSCHYWVWWCGPATQNVNPGEGNCLLQREAAGVSDPPSLPAIAPSNLLELGGVGFAVWLNMSLHVMMLFWWEVQRTSTPFTFTVFHDPGWMLRGSRVSFSSWWRDSLNIDKPL